MSTKWQSVIGIEVHLQLKTGTKVWCGCSADYDNDDPNTHTCPICLGHPGALPKLNKKVVEYAVKGALALNCQINNESSFDRKNYFYPDTPKNYQITQFDKSFAEKGYVQCKTNSGKDVRVGITKIQIEEDAGKSIHTGHESLINFNRASIPLVEIISDPDMRTSEEAYAYLTELRKTIKNTGISDVSMELGSMRCDVNVSVMPEGSDKFGTRVEIKNLNSFKAATRAIDYEIGRQIETIENGGEVYQETRLWDEETGSTKVMRTKEEAMDYRYFPEPDLLHLHISDAEIEAIKATLPERIEEKAARFMTSYNISEYDANILCEDMELADYYESVAKATSNPKLAANWIITEVLRILKEREITIASFEIKPENLGKMITLMDKSVISSKIAKELFGIMLTDDRDPDVITREKGMLQVSDEGEISRMVDEVIAACPDMVADYNAADEGKKPRVLKGFVGQVMKASKGKANPQLVNDLLLKKLAKK